MKAKFEVSPCLNKTELHAGSPRPPLGDADRGTGRYSHMGFSCPMSSSFVHFAHSFLSVLMEQRMGPQGFPQSSMAGTFR